MCRFTRQPASRDNVKRNHLFHPTAKLASATPKRGRGLGYPVAAMRDIRLTELQGIHVLVIRRSPISPASNIARGVLVTAL